MMASSSTTTAADDDSGATSIAALHPEIVRTHILSRLDGPTLAAASCSSPLLHALISSDDELWRDVCRAAWPSTAHPSLRSSISAFPSGHRSFFADSFPPLLPRHDRSESNLVRSLPRPPSRLISAVDIHYRGEPVFSEVVETDTASPGWFGAAPFRIDLLLPDAAVPIPAELAAADGSPRGHRAAEDLTVSWIALDPSRSRSASVSSRRPVSVQLRRRWLRSWPANPRDDDEEVRYSTVVGGGGEKGTAAEMVELAVVVVVTCGGKGGGGPHVREVGLRVEDMDGRNLSGEDSLGILGEAMMGRRGRYHRYEEFVEKRRERRERKERIERMTDLACMAFGISIFFALWCFLLLR